MTKMQAAELTKTKCDSFALFREIFPRGSAHLTSAASV